MHVESGDEFVSDGVCLALDDGISVWWVVAQVIGERIRVDAWVRVGELSNAARATNRDAKSQQLTGGGRGRTGV